MDDNTILRRMALATALDVKAETIETLTATLFRVDDREYLVLDDAETGEAWRAAILRELNVTPPAELPPGPIDRNQWVRDVMARETPAKILSIDDDHDRVGGYNVYRVK